MWCCRGRLTLADGYTWLWAMDPVLTVSKHIYRTSDCSSDAIVVLNAAARFSQTLICNPGLGKSVKDAGAAKVKG